MRDLDLTILRLYVAVCETGNMARTSERSTNFDAAMRVVRANLALSWFRVR